MDLMLAKDVGIWPQDRFFGRTWSFWARVGEPSKSFKYLNIFYDEVMQELNSLNEGLGIHFETGRKRRQTTQQNGL